MRTQSPDRKPWTRSLALAAVIAGAACSESVTAPEASAPTVVELPAASHGAIDESEYKATCLAVPEDPPQVSPTCPVLRWDGYDYWAMSYTDNRSSMAIHVFDPSGRLVRVEDRPGARYTWAIDVDEVAETVTFRGQADRTVTMTWSELRGLR